MTQFSLGEFTEVADRVFVAVAEPAAVNIGLVVADTGCLVIDTGSSPEQGAAIRAAAEQCAGVPVAAVVVTHHHFDHLFGLAGFAGVPSYGHDSLTASLTTPEAASAAAELGIDAGDLIGVEHGFSLAKVIEFGGRRVEALHFGPAHTDGDVAIYVPDAQLVFAGDLLESSADPSFGPDCHLRQWPLALDGILGLTRPETRIIPGHGPVMDRFEAFDQRSRISALYSQVEYVIGLGKRVEDAYDAAEWPFSEETVRAMLPLAYAQFAAAGITPKRQLPLL